MADKEGFSFEEEEKSPSGTEAGISWMEQEDHSEITQAPENGRKGSMTRILLLVLLLVAVGAGGFYFLTGTSEVMEPSPAPPQVAVKKQPIAVPARPVEENPPAEKEPMAAVAETAPQDAAPETPKAAEKKDLPEKSPEVAQAVPAEKADIPPSNEATEQLAPAAGDYSVAAGAFLLRANLADAERKVQASGFTPRVVHKKKKMDMTRLRVGTFSPQEGKQKMEELAELTPDAFYLPVEGGIAVYAASFQNVDKARNFADRLYKRGLRVEEEPARVEIPLYLLSFGGFADLESARKAADQVRTAGLEAMVIKNP
jgi:cell division septation protein DedD